MLSAFYFRSTLFPSNHPYTSKFVLNVLDLTHIELATEEDKTYGIDAWARLFKARTWEDLKMIAKQNSTLQQASETLYTLNCDQTIRDMARARERMLSGMKIVSISFLRRRMHVLPNRAWLFPK